MRSPGHNAVDIGDKRQCGKCGEFFPLTDEHFYRNPTCRAGLGGTCKTCHRKHHRPTITIGERSGPHNTKIFHPEAVQVADPVGYPEDIERPKTRADCASVPRPCPFVSCKHHLYLQVVSKGARAGWLQLNYPELAPWDMDPEASCALDVVDCGELIQSEIAACLHMERERVRQILEEIYRKLGRKPLFKELREAA